MKLYNFEKEENNWDEREEGLSAAGWPMLRIVILVSSPYPKPSKQQTSFAVWLFSFSSAYTSELVTLP